MKPKIAPPPVLKKDDGSRRYGFLERVAETTADQQDNEEEEDFEDGVLFYVNKSGFPMDNKTWERMWHHVSRIHPDGAAAVARVRSSRHLPEMPYLQAPMSFTSTTSVFDRLEAIQKYMSDLQYNHTGTQFYEIRKNRPISGLMDTAREMVRESLPIKCLEAVILALYLTNGMSGVDRFTISFKTTFNGNVHRHVVLGVYWNGKYGALGMSRRDDLMYKPIIYKSLSELMLDFHSSYKKYWHEVKKIKIGLPVPHDAHSYEQIHWKTLSLSVPKTSKEELSRDLDRHGREMRSVQKFVTSENPQVARRSLTGSCLLKSGSGLASEVNSAGRKTAPNPPKNNKKPARKSSPKKTTTERQDSSSKSPTEEKKSTITHGAPPQPQIKETSDFQMRI